MRLALLLSVAFTVGAAQSRAQDLRPLCPDRPAKGTSPCTVDRGHMQVEVDLADVTRDRSAGERTVVTALASPTLKWGVTDALDLEAAWTPYIREASHSANGASNAVSGVGDLYFRAKANVTGNRDHGINLALAPFLKVPTANHGLGDGAWEEGIVAALAGSGPAGWTWDLTAEADRLRDEAGRGWHGAASLALGLTHALGPLSATAELWTARNDDPDGRERQVSADAALAWIPKGQPNLQLDAGVNLGLNHQTPDVQAYLGVARRF